MPAGVDARVSRVQVHATGLPEESPCGRRKVGGAFQQRVKHPAGSVTARRRQEAKVEPKAAGRK